MTDVDASQVGGTVGASQPGGVVGASQVGGTVGARLAKPQADLWTPAELGSDLALWLDWKDSDFDLRTDGGTDYVTSWEDLSGNGNDATQEAASRQPEKTDLGLSYDGSDRLQTGIIPKVDQPNIIVGLHIYNEESKFIDIVDNTVFGRGRQVLGVRSGNYRLWSGSDKGDEFQDFIPNAPLVQGGLYNSPNSISSVDGELSAGQKTGPNDLSGVVLGGDKDVSFKQNAFIVARNGSVSRLRKLVGFLAHKAARNGIPEPLANLPDSHPHKSTPPTV